MSRAWERSSVCPRPCPRLGPVAFGVFAIKVYALALLYVLSRQTRVREDYETFVFVPRGQTREARLDAAERSFFERLAPYDGQFYLDIARRGYRLFGSGEPIPARGPPGNYAFFPLLPFLLRSTQALAGHEGGLGMLLFANLLFSGAGAVGVYALACRVGAPPWPSALLLLTFPAAAFQCALYTESLFLCLSVGAALCAGSKRFWTGALLGYLAGLSRPQGVLVSALWAPRPGRRASEVSGWCRVKWPLLLAVVAPLAGMATFSAVLWLRIGSPLGFLRIQSYWTRDFSPSRLLREVIYPWRWEHPPLDYAAFLLGLALLPWLWRRLPPALALYGTLSVLFPIATGSVLSFSRFLSVSFPHFLCLAKVLERWRVATGVLIAGFIALQCFLAKGLVSWYFVG